MYNDIIWMRLLVISFLIALCYGREYKLDHDWNIICEWKGRYRDNECVEPRPLPEGVSWEYTVMYQRLPGCYEYANMGILLNSSDLFAPDDDFNDIHAGYTDSVIFEQEYWAKLAATYNTSSSLVC